MEFTDNFGAAIFADDNAHRMQFRTELIGGTLERLLGDELARMSVLDIGCNSGWFSFDLAERGARSVEGVDLRPNNVEQARFLSEYFGLDDRTEFDVADVRCPVIVLHGGSDTIAHPAFAPHTAEIVPNATLRMYDDLGHFSIVTKVVETLSELPLPPHP